MYNEIEVETEQDVVQAYDAASAGADRFGSVKRSGSFQQIDSDHGATSSMMALSSGIAAAQQQSHMRSRLAATRASEQPKDAIGKRIADVVGAVFILLMISPLLAACAVLVLISSPGPIFYKQRRIGRGGNSFLMWKFRSMCANADRVLEKHLETHPEARIQWNATHKLTNDPRVTRIGRIMRKLSLDELPQLINVIKGEMSLIGPRPIVTAEVEKYGDAISAYYAVRPGMTGLWQVSGRSDTSYAERVRLDKQYVRECSPQMDAMIILKTVRVLLSAEGAY